MYYENILPARFLSRPNRFIAHVELNGIDTVCHVKNTGRCRELLLPGAEVYIQASSKPQRKTAYDLIAVRKGDRLVNIDSQAPNRVFGEYAASGAFLPQLTLIRPESRFGSSRFDFYVESPAQRAFVEVKGVTLERSGEVLFPDAPTQRGARHLTELVACREQGFDAYAVFIIQMENVRCFRPNGETDPIFARSLSVARQAGVHILAYDCLVTPESLEIRSPVPVLLP